MDKHISGYDLNSIDVLVHVRYISSILDGLDGDKEFFKLDSRRYGKRIRQINEFNNRETLSRSDIQKARTYLARVLEVWNKEGNKEWTCEEGPDAYMALVFRRKA